MPDNGAASAPAAAASLPHPDASPDRVGEELADDAHIWRVYDRVAKEDDDRRIASWNRGLDNLALFAGLFSAVTTAFIIEAQNDMKPDYAQLTFRVLNASVFDQQFVPEPFVVPSGARLVNCLWASSLVLSLSAALIAIMGKDWIGMYASRPVCNPRQWAEMRTYRLRCVERWYMSGVISAAPVLLHISLLSFGAGLVGFMSSDPFSHRLTLVLCLLAGVLYVATALSAVLFPGSPFKSPATQTIRAVLPEFVLFLRVNLSTPKRNALLTLQEAINGLVAPALVDASRHQRRSLRSRLVWVFRDAGLPGLEAHRGRSSGSLLQSFCNRVASFLPFLCALPRVFIDECRYRRQRPRAKPYWVSVASWYRDLRVRDAFLGSAWTEIAVDRRLMHLSDALMWLSDASQAPEVLRALMFALGDLDIGQQVGQLAPSELCARIRAEIRHGWRKADYAALSRYVLADQNLPQGPFLQPDQFFTRYDVEKNPSLRCEHGLAASVLLGPSATRTVRFGIKFFFPDHMSQPRMAEFLLPRIAEIVYQSQAAEPFVLLANRYWSALRGDQKFNLEIEMYKRLGPRERSGYVAWVMEKCTGRAGPVELLTFINLRVYNGTEKDVVELILQILESETKRDLGHSCLVYLFEPWSRRHADSQWADVRWPSTWAVSLLDALLPSYVRCMNRDPRLPYGFALALTRTVVVLFLPVRKHTDWAYYSLRYLSRQLCGPRSLLDDLEKDEVVDLILKKAALSPIVSWTRRDDSASFRLAILVTVIRSITRCLGNTETFNRGVRLFGRLAYAEATHPSGRRVIWDLGEWLRRDARHYFSESSTESELQQFHAAMMIIYPLCARSGELHAHWDRIGYPGRPGDAFSDPLLNLGQFFLMAEQPLTNGY